MPPPPSKKATAASKPPKTERRSVSRHSTPVSALTDSTAPPTPLTATSPTIPTIPHSAAAPQRSSSSSSNVPNETAYLRTSTAALLNNDASIDQLISRTSARNAEPPTAKELTNLHDTLRDTITKSMRKRGEICDRSMRELARRRKKRMQMEREREEEDEAEERRKIKKRSHDEMEVDARKAEAAADEEEWARRRESLPSVGAHGLARQDGVGVPTGQPPPPSPPVQPGTATVDPMDTANSPSDSEDERADPPSTVPLYERAFGKDPTKFDDPTIYEIRPVTADMTDDEKRRIYNVAHWPTVDLTEYTAGEPPDADFSNAKPANQVNFSTFQTYVEPYIRPFTEEDVAFLKERGDRVQPFLIPEFGRKGYKELWAAEDGLTGLEPPIKAENNPNEPRGSMADMDDATAETDEVSAGPVMERLLSLIRPAPNANAKKEDNTANDAEGDTSMVNGDENPDAQPGAPEEPNHKPITALPPDAPRVPNLPSLDYATMDQRLVQELRYIGFLDPSETPDYSAHADDEVSARLRTLQHELRRVSHLNNVRKARVLELTEERMAMQEYSNIADDLDNQVNAAYLKRNRSLASKPSKKGAAAAARAAAQKGVAASVGGGGRGVSDGVRALMQKRRDWIDMVGPVVKYGRGDILRDDQTIFDDEALAKWERAEREAEGGEGEAE